MSFKRDGRVDMVHCYINDKRDGLFETRCYRVITRSYKLESRVEMNCLSSLDVVTVTT